MAVRKDDLLLRKTGYSLFYKVIGVEKTAIPSIWSLLVVRVKPSDDKKKVVTFGKVQYYPMRKGSWGPECFEKITLREILNS